MKRGLFILILLFVIFSIYPASALESGSCVTAVVNDITPSSVKINEDFTVGILIDNCGDSVPENITFELRDVSPYITIKEPLFKIIGEMGYANSNRFILYHMRTLENAKPGDYLFNFRLIYGENGFRITKDGSFSVTVIADKAKLSIASIKTDPVLPYKGDIVELTIRVENTGDGTAKSVEVYMNHSFQGLKQSFIGALDSNEDGPAVLTFIVDEVGEFEFPVTISYEDDFGDNEVKTQVSFNVLKKKSNFVTIIIAILIIAVFGWGIYHFIKTKKKKDETIQQLLKGNNSNGKNKNHLFEHNNPIGKNKKSKNKKTQLPLKKNNPIGKNKKSLNKKLGKNV